MQTFARKLNLIALALGAALTAPGCATDWFSSSSSDYVAGELSQDVENLPDPNAPPTPPKRPAIVSPLGAAFKESPDRLLLQANAYFEQGKFHDSSRLYQKYLATPEAAAAPPTVLGQAHYRIAVVARKKMSFAEAKREFETALRYEPQNQLYRFELGKSAFDGADYATADAAFSALIAQNPNYPQAQYYYGLTLLEGTRRAEAIAPLTKAVGELEAAALLTDKYYALGESENAAAWEAQTTQIAARLGRPVPALPNKPAFASTTQPQVPTQTAPANQPQIPVQTAPANQPQIPAQTAPATQPQIPVQTAPANQPQIPVQIELPPTAQAPLPSVPDAQLSGPLPFAATVAPPTFEEKPVSPVEPLAVAPLDAANAADVEPRPLADATPETQTTQNNAQESISETLVAQTDDTAAPAPVSSAQNAKAAEDAQSLTAHIGRGNPGLFASTTADSAPLAAETGFRPGSISTAAPLTAQTTQETQTAQTLPNVQTTQETQIAQTLPNVQTTQETQITQTLPNVQTTQETQIAQTLPNAQTTQETQTAQTLPNVQTTQETQIAQTTPFIGPSLPEPSCFDAEAAFRRVERLVELENCVAEYFAPLAPIYETAPSPFQVAEAEELYAAAPSPSDLSVDEEEEFDENDDFAFASSGTPQAPVAPAPSATIGGFGSYQAPTFDASPVAPAQPIAQNAPTSQTSLVPQNVQTTPIPQIAQNAPAAQATLVPQIVQTTQIPQIAQNAPAAQTTQIAPNVLTTQIPFVSQYAPTAQTSLVPQNAQTAQIPQVAQNAPTAVSQYAAPNAVPRRPATPEERLQAAIAAGAEVREISPEEYRRAVSVGLNGQAQPR